MTDKSLPIEIDFLAGKLDYRRKRATLKNEMLARALGLQRKKPMIIVDATAGLGRDSFIIATLGFEVQLIERSPEIYAALKEGMARAKNHPEIDPIIQRMHLVHADAIAWLGQQTSPPTVVYLDPMFPERKKSALVKKEMRIFHELVGDDLDADALLKAALTCATERVVVKRPRLADFLAELKPSFSLSGSSSRFDVYLTRTGSSL